MTRFIAINWRSYDTWRMRMTLTMLVFTALAILPLRAQAFDVEQALREQHPQYPGEQVFELTQANGMTLSQAIESVKRRTGGRVVGAETKVQGGREVHHIRVLKDGKVKTYKVNGRRR